MEFASRPGRTGTGSERCRPWPCVRGTQGARVHHAFRTRKKLQGLVRARPAWSYFLGAGRERTARAAASGVRTLGGARACRSHVLCLSSRALAPRDETTNEVLTASALFRECGMHALSSTA